MGSKSGAVNVKMKNASSTGGKSTKAKNESTANNSKPDMNGKPFPKGGKGSSC